MKPPVVLTFNLSPERFAKLRLVAMRLKIHLRPVENAECTQTLSALCGLDDVDLTLSAPDAAFADEMMVMANFTDAQVNHFLAGLRQARFTPIRLKAVLTPTNASWTPLMLHEELLKEDAAFRTHATPAHTTE